MSRPRWSAGRWERSAPQETGPFFIQSAYLLLALTGLGVLIGFTVDWWDTRLRPSVNKGNQLRELYHDLLATLSNGGSEARISERVVEREVLRKKLKEIGIDCPPLRGSKEDWKPYVMALSVAAQEGSTRKGSNIRRDGTLESAMDGPMRRNLVRRAGPGFACAPNRMYSGPGIGPRLAVPVDALYEVPA